VSRGAMSLSERVQEQAAALEQTSATMNQMSSAVQNNTQHAFEASKLSVEVQTHADEGAQIMAQTIKAMSEIQDSSHKIADIVTLIDGIAFQTNLLALNAAVEAARAGEHGRGFAVVASEVRNLSQKSAEAAKDIKGLIDESVTRINHGTQLASSSGERLKVMNESVKQMSSMISQIASASEEQSEGIRQVHQAITQIDQVTQQNAALVEETSAASESMTNQATELSRNMAFFRTAQGQQQLSSPSMSSPKPALAKPQILPKTPQKQPGLVKNTPKNPVLAFPKIAGAKPASHNDSEWDDF
jgi:methyl-accepting chemotaxis protein